MSYRDPKQAIDQTYTILAQGLEKFYANIGSSVEAFVKKKKEDEEAAQKALNKRLKTGMNPFMKEYNKTIKEGTKWTSKMKDEGAQLQTQITANLELIREQLKREIITLGADATTEQIQDLSNRALVDVTSLKNSVMTFNEARTEYAETAGLDPNQVNAIVPTRNQGLIAMMGDFVDDDKHNMYLHNVNYDPSKPQDYKLGNADWNVSNYEGTLGGQDFKIKNSINATNLQKDHKDKTFFNHVEEFVPKTEYSAIHGVIKDKLQQNDPQYVTEKDDRLPLRGGTAKDKARYVINKEALRNYLKTNAAGQNLMHTYIDDEDKYGHWQQLVGKLEDDSKNPGSQIWSTQTGGSNEYDEDKYLDLLINNAIESYRYE